MAKQRDKQATPRTDDPAVDATEGAESEGATVEAVEVSEAAAALIEQLQVERDEAIERRQRALADFANFQRRSVENERRAREGGVSDLARALLPVLDDLGLALGQDREQLTVDQLWAGVQLVRDGLVKAIESHGITAIDPRPGEEFDPMRHQAVMRQEGEGIEPNHVVASFQTGYAIGDLVLRPATVSVAPCDEE